MKQSENVTDSVSSMDTLSTCLQSFRVALNVHTIVSLESRVVILDMDFFQISSNFLCRYISSQIKSFVFFIGIFENRDSDIPSSLEMVKLFNIDEKS